jgi:hypothetical protein
LNSSTPYDVEDYQIYELIRDGFFVEAISGIKYTESGFSEGIKTLRGLIDVGEQRLKQVNS